MLWLPVVGYEGRYEVSESGEVRSTNYRQTGKCRLLKRNKDSHGYWSVTVYTGNGMKDRRSVGVHQLVAAAFIGPKPSGMDVNHIDGQRINNDRVNLEYVTRSENIKHAVRLGLKARWSPVRDPKTGRALSKAAARLMLEGG